VGNRDPCQKQALFPENMGRGCTEKSKTRIPRDDCMSCICSLLYDAFSSSESIWSDERMISEL
jgi:hypothetical protein